MTRRRHRPEGAPGDEFAEFVRRSLHTAAEHVEPNPDGLERIREKIRSGPVYASAAEPEAGARRGLWGSGVLAGLVRRLSGARGEHSAPRGHGAPPRPGRAAGRAPGRGAGPGHARPAQRRPMDWREAMLRPALAIGVAVFALAVVLAAVPPLRHFVQVSADVFAGSSSSTPSSPRAGGTGQGSSTNGVEGSASLGITSPSAVPCSSPSPSHASSLLEAQHVEPHAVDRVDERADEPERDRVAEHGQPVPERNREPDRHGEREREPERQRSTGSASASATGSASASDSASAKASASASSSPRASTSRRAATHTPTPTRRPAAASQRPPAARPPPRRGARRPRRARPARRSRRIQPLDV